MGGGGTFAALGSPSAAAATGAGGAFAAAATCRCEKTARLRELRLAREAANGGAVTRAPVRGSAPAAKKTKARKSGEKGPSLSDWLDTQQNQGRRG